MPVREKAGSADRVVALGGQKVHGLAVFVIPFELGGNRLFRDEYGLADAPQIGIVFLPIGEANVNVIHQQTPDYLA